MIRSHSRHSFPSDKGVPVARQRHLSGAQRGVSKALHTTKRRQHAARQIREALIDYACGE